MAPQAMQILLVLGSVGAFIFLAAGCGGNVWIQAKSPNVLTSGLWKICGADRCVKTEDYIKLIHPGATLKSWFQACRAFSILSVLAAVAGILLSILSLLVEKIKGFFASLFLICAVGAMAISLIIYASEQNMSYMKYGWTYFMGCIGVVVAAVSAVFGFCSGRSGYSNIK